MEVIRLCDISVNDVQSVPRFPKARVVEARQFDEVGHEDDARRLPQPQIGKGFIRFSNLTLDLTEGSPGNDRRQQVVACPLCIQYHR